MNWCVYLIECMDGSLYTGTTNNIDRRVKLHSIGKGSKYVAAKGFKRVIATHSCKDQSEACVYEYEIKQLSREEKVQWFTLRTSMDVKIMSVTL